MILTATRPSAYMTRPCLSGKNCAWMAKQTLMFSMHRRNLARPLIFRKFAFRSVNEVKMLAKHNIWNKIIDETQVSVRKNTKPGFATAMARKLIGINANARLDNVFLLAFKNLGRSSWMGV